MFKRSLRQLAAAFMLYSKIPVPLIKADEEDMEGAIMFLPLVGFVIGVLTYIILFVTGKSVTGRVDIPVFVRATAVILVPIVVTGGFHIDGFMDTTDALRSYSPRERKLEIMSDPHTGSFAVIGLVTVILFMLAGLGILLGVVPADRPVFINICGVFVLSRVVTALTSVYIKKARDNGLLVKETSKAGHAHTAVICIQGIAAVAAMVYENAVLSCVTAAVFAAFALYYRHMVLKNFGGVTGDTAGYCVTVSETVAVTVLALAGLIGTLWR